MLLPIFTSVILKVGKNAASKYSILQGRASRPL
jgi:hypothetical protein